MTETPKKSYGFQERIHAFNVILSKVEAEDKFKEEVKTEIRRNSDNVAALDRRLSVAPWIVSRAMLEQWCIKDRISEYTLWAWLADLVEKGKLVKCGKSLYRKRINETGSKRKSYARSLGYK